MISKETLAWLDRDARTKDTRYSTKSGAYKAKALEIQAMRRAGVRVKVICEKFDLSKTTVVRMSRESFDSSNENNSQHQEPVLPIGGVF